MGAQSHNDEVVRLLLTRPPSPSGKAVARRCDGVKVIPAHWEWPGWNHGAREARWVDQQSNPCLAHASVWLPELNYCAHHIPAEWIPVVNERGRRWTEYATWIWEQILAEVPTP